MKFNLIWIVLLFAFGSINAQGSICGNEFIQLTEKDRQTAIKFFQEDHLPYEKSGIVDSVAVTIHIVEFRGVGRIEINPEEIEAELEKVNRIFNSAGVHFFICGSPRYIDGGGTYTMQTGDQLNRENHVPNTINIYFVDAIESGFDFTIVGYCSFPYFDSPSTRYVMMSKPASTDGGTLIHELGHFYGVWHTHETSLGGLEYVDGSNCDTAGDLLCDTRADPNLITPGLMSGCNYIGQLLDPKGDPYVPPVTNFMSYASAACTRFFSDQQMAIIRDVHKDQNAYLANRCDFYPDFGVSPETINTLSIRSDEDIRFSYNFDQIGLEREYEVTLKISIAEEPEATGLLLQEERLRILPGDPPFSKTYDLDFPIELGTGTYYLKAVIDSENEVIERTEKNNTASTIVKVDNSSLDDVLIFPNPVTDQLKLFLRNDKANGKLNIRIFRYNGQLIWENEGFKSQEEYFKILDVSQFITGLYIISIDFVNANADYSFKFLKQ